jgi:hypothetical protein
LALADFKAWLAWYNSADSPLAAPFAISSRRPTAPLKNNLIGCFCYRHAASLSVINLLAP